LESWVLNTADLLRCYATGRFPMANDRDDPTVFLVNPELRGVLPLSAFHIPKSLKKLYRRKPFDLAVDEDFRGVIEACAEPRPERPRTWLNDGLIELYVRLFQMGSAHSIELRQGHKLVGGLYGVSLGGAFFGESMFSRETGASKIALIELVARLRAGGFTLLDTQFVTDHLSRFGAIEISRKAYLEALYEAIRTDVTFPTERGWFADRLFFANRSRLWSDQEAPSAQSSTHTS